MVTIPQHQQETGRWLRLGAARGQEEPDSGEGFQKSDDDSKSYTIREMARDFQVSIRTLRFYEDRGLLHPRREGTNRRYDSRDRLHLKMILKGKSLGFTLSEIHGILAGQGVGSEKPDIEMGLLPEQITAQIDYLERHRSQIEEAINTLREAQKHLLESTGRGAGRENQSGP